MADALHGRLAASLGSRYRLMGEAGSGGFAVVFRARDLRHDADVAIKVLRPDVTEALGHDRFLREIRVTAGLQHPHILPVLDSGEADGLLYYVMPFVAGDSLRARLDRDGSLPIAEAIRLAAEIADALDYAARRGITHRDIKPENILLSEGHAVVADLGVAQVLDDATRSRLTGSGVAIGTPAYMSPEQAAGDSVGPATDVYSLGCVLFETLTGQPPFSGPPTAVIRQHLAAEVPSARRLRPEVSSELDAAIRRALAKNPGQRFPSAADFATAILTRPARRNRPLRVAAGVVAIVVLSVAVLSARSLAHERHARNELLPHAQQLMESGSLFEAYRILREVEKVLPQDPVLAGLMLEMTTISTIVSTPAGAAVNVRAFTDPPDQWQLIGTTPVSDVRLPSTAVVYRLVLEGYQPQEELRMVRRRHVSFELVPDSAVPDDMVRVPGGRPLAETNPSDSLLPFLVERYEVTNRRYLEFVRDGGYERAEFWSAAAGDDIDLAAVRARFTDRTGRVGPATWSLGTFPTGKEDHPVEGVSWYEAAAYCAWAGRQLPTMQHWTKAAEPFLATSHLRFANFAGSGTTPVGEPLHLEAWGTYGLAGNVKEWVANDAGGGLRYILGGGWNEPGYQFIELDARAAADRDAGFGFRCVRYPASQAYLADERRLPWTHRPTPSTPVDDAAFELLRRQFANDHLPLDARVESTETHADWRIERVSYAAAYSGERIPAVLFLPTNVQPPYQTVVYFPGLGAFLADAPFDDAAGQREWFMFLVRTGRAVFVPVYKGTYQRHAGSMSAANSFRDITIAAGRDLIRSVDYLHTRDDIDPQRIAYFGVSAGAYMGAIYTAVEQRFAASVLLAGGLFGPAPRVPEIAPEHYLPRVYVPTVMINGRYDYVYPHESAQVPMYELLGTPDADKLHCVFESGHMPVDRDVIVRVSLDWLDRYLGPPGSSSSQPQPVRCARASSSQRN